MYIEKYKQKNTTFIYKLVYKWTVADKCQMVYFLRNCSTFNKFGFWVETIT